MNAVQHRNMTRRTTKYRTLFSVFVTLVLPVFMLGVAVTLLGIASVVPDPDGVVIAAMSFPFFALGGMGLFVFALRTGVVR